MKHETHLSLPWKRIHFIGVGGVGMSGLAMICLDAGVHVSGSDMASSSILSTLAERGARIHTGHDAAHLGTPEVVVYSSAVSPENPEFAEAQRQGLTLVRRGDFLAQVADAYPRVVAIAGSHGKTTVTAMCVHLMKGHDRCQPGYLVGGAVPDWSAPAAAGRGELLITEVDESDSTQASMKCSIGVVVNVEDDHCWSVGGEEALRQCFRDFAAGADTLIAGASDEAHSLFSQHPDVQFFQESQILPGLDLLVPGLHNRFNATLAVEVAVRLGMPRSAAVSAMAGFGGVDRRQTVRYAGPGTVVIEDYAHHPTEVRATLQALRERYPERRLVLVFQPHRFERVARYGAEFAHELGAADAVTVTRPFGAWVNDGDLADPRNIVDGITDIPCDYSESSWPKLAARVSADSDVGDLVVVMGAGDITEMVEPLIAGLTARDM